MLPVNENFKRLREKSGMTQSEVGKRLLVSAGMINKIESGAETPSLHLCYKFTDLMGCPVESLFNENSE